MFALISAFVTCFMIGLFVFSGMLSVFIMISLSLGLIYGKWYWDRTEENAGREWKTLRTWHWPWRFFHWYLGIDIIYDFSGDEATVQQKIEKLEDGKCILAAQPHGMATCLPIIGLGYNGGMSKENQKPWMKKTHIAAATLIFRLPLYREGALWCGSVVANAKVIRSLLEKNKIVVDIIGGVQEMMYDSSVLDIYDGHSGFLRIANDMNALVYPVYCKGEQDLFFKLNIFMPIQKFFTKLVGYPFPVVALGPFKGSTAIVIGEPMDVSKFGSIKIAKGEFYSRQCQLISKYENSETVHFGPTIQKYLEIEPTTQSIWQ